MSTARKEYKEKPGEYKSIGTLTQAVAFNGNFLCEHAGESDGYGGKNFFLSIVDPVMKTTIARSDNFSCAWEDRYLLPFSNDEFLYHHQYGKIYRLRIEGIQLKITEQSTETFHRIYPVKNKQLVCTAWMQDPPFYKLTTVSLESLKIQHESKDDIKPWLALSSGKIIKFRADDANPIHVYNTLHDEKPVKLACQHDYFSPAFGHYAVELSDNLIAYDLRYGPKLKKLNVIHNLAKNQSILLPIDGHDEKLIFARLPDNTTLIYSKPNFYLLDNETLTLSPIELGLDIKTKCTSISYANGRVALTFKDSDVLYISNELKPKNEIEDIIIKATNPNWMSRPLASIIYQYRGRVTLFAKHHSVDGESVGHSVNPKMRCT